MAVHGRLDSCLETYYLVEIDTRPPHATCQQQATQHTRCQLGRPTCLASHTRPDVRGAAARRQQFAASDTHIRAGCDPMHAVARRPLPPPRVRALLRGSRSIISWAAALTWGTSHPGAEAPTHARTAIPRAPPPHAQEAIWPYLAVWQAGLFVVFAVALCSALVAPRLHSAAGDCVLKVGLLKVRLLRG